LRVSGRLGGAEIARREWFVQGKLPLSTLKSDVDYGYSIAVTKYGTIGVKMLDLQRRRRGLTGTSTSERPRKGREEARKTC